MYKLNDNIYACLFFNYITHMDKIYFMNYDGRSQPVRIKNIYYRIYYTKLYVISVIT